MNVADQVEIADPGTRVRIYVGERDNYRGKPLWSAYLELVRTEGAAGASVLRGVAAAQTADDGVGAVSVRGVLSAAR